MFDLDFIGEEVKAHLGQGAVVPSAWQKGNLSEFGKCSTYAVRLIFREKEIILFSMLQWVAIGLTYYLWVQIIGWIPDEVWQSHSRRGSLPLNLAFLAWSVVCVSLAAYPIAIFTGAMGASHLLRQQGYPSTIAGCMKLALSNSWNLWMFNIADGWLTVSIILSRLPSKDYFKNPAGRLAEELLYYAWKIGTLGMPAALLTGKGLVDAGKSSLDLVKHKWPVVMRLRGGYSAFCWIIGIATYASVLVIAKNSPGLFEGKHQMFHFYALMGVPILAAVGVINLFLRPIFVIGSCKLYSDNVKERGEAIVLPPLPGRGTSAFVAFLVLAVIVGSVFLYREELGLSAILNGAG